MRRVFSPDVLDNGPAVVLHTIAGIWAIAVQADQNDFSL
jgi:hypothetical protein